MDGFVKNIWSGVRANMRRQDRPLPGMAGVARAQQEAAEEHEVAVPERLVHARGMVGIQQRPAVTGAEDRPIAQLDQARVLRAAEGMGENVFRLAAPCLAAVARAHENEVTVGVGVRVGFFTEQFAVRRAAKRGDQFAVRPPYDRRKGTVKFLVLVDDNVFDLANGGRRLRGGFGLRGRRCEKADGREQEDESVHARQ